MKRVIITGANGFIGSRLVQELSEGTHEIFAVVKDNKENVDNIVGLNGVHIIYCEMSEYDTLPQKISDNPGGVDIFYHFAWDGTAGEKRADIQAQLDNVIYTCKAYRAASELGTSKFVYTASVMEFEVIKQFEDNVSGLKPHQIYSSAKLTAHLMLACLSNMMAGTGFCSVIISNIFGPGESSPRLVNTTIRKLLNGEKLSFTHGRQLYDFIYIDDVVRGIKAVGDKGIFGRNYYLGSCRIMPLYQYLEIIGHVVGASEEMKFGEIPFDGVSLTYSEFNINQLYMDIGFKAEVSFEEGIKKTVDWIIGKKSVQDFSVVNTRIDGVKIINPFFAEDKRGYFLKDFEKTMFHYLGMDNTDIAECFETESAKNVIRGLHFQTRNPQAKIVRVLSGCVYDVIVDLRKSSQTFGHWEGFELSSENKKVLYMPKGFAHGFISFFDNTVVSYKCVGKYEREADTGILWNDPDISIEWPLKGKAVVSERDQSLMTFKAFVNKFGGL